MQLKLQKTNLIIFSNNKKIFLVILELGFLNMSSSDLDIPYGVVTVPLGA